MKLFRCSLCANAYLGDSTLSHCPFCSVDGRHLLPATEWQDIVVSELSVQSQGNLEQAMQLEADAAKFYNVAYETASDPLFEAMFSALSRMEYEHAATIARLLDVDVPAPAEAPSFVSAVEYLAAANKLEKKIARFYKTAAREANEPDIKTLFTAFGEAAREHTNISKLGQ